MTARPGKPLIAQLGIVPPEVATAVGNQADLVHWTDVSDSQAPSVTHALTSAMAGATPAMLERFPNLGHIASCGAGLDQFEFDDLARRGIELHHTAHVMTHDTAEMAVALIFTLLRRVLQNDAHVRSGAWQNGRAPSSTRIVGKKVGIVGLGQIGRNIARMLDAIGLSVAYTGPNPKPDMPWTYVRELEALARKADILVLSCAGGPSTHRMINEDVLRALGANGYLINVSRGSVVDEDALIEALQNQRIAGAALDVFDNEPAPDPRFAALDTVVLQPHAATLTRENRAELAAEILRALSLAN